MSNTQKSAPMSAARKFQIFGILIVKGLLNLQSIVRELKGLRTKIKMEKERVQEGYVADIKKIFSDVTDVLAKATSIKQEEMKEFCKEVLKQLVGSPGNITPERRDEILFKIFISIGNEDAAVAVLDEWEKIIAENISSSETNKNEPKKGNDSHFLTAHSYKAFNKAADRIMQKIASATELEVEEVRNAYRSKVLEIIDGL